MLILEPQLYIYSVIYYSFTPPTSLLSKLVVCSLAQHIKTFTFLWLSYCFDHISIICISLTELPWVTRPYPSCCTKWCWTGHWSVLMDMFCVQIAPKSVLQVFGFPSNTPAKCEVGNKSWAIQADRQTCLLVGWSGRDYQMGKAACPWGPTTLTTSTRNKFATVQAGDNKRLDKHPSYK